MKTTDTTTNSENQPVLSNPERLKNRLVDIYGLMMIIRGHAAALAPNNVVPLRQEILDRTHEIDDLIATCEMIIAEGGIEPPTEGL